MACSRVRDSETQAQCCCTTATAAAKTAQEILGEDTPIPYWGAGCGPTKTLQELILEARENDLEKVSLEEANSSRQLACVGNTEETALEDLDDVRISGPILFDLVSDLNPWIHLDEHFGAGVTEPCDTSGVINTRHRHSRRRL